MTLALCRFSLAFIWIYQGVVPKWLGPHEDEIAMNLALGLTESQAVMLSLVGGSLEVLLGVVLLLAGRHAWPYLLSAGLIGMLTVFVIALAPAFLLSAFNAASVNVAILALSLIGWRTSRLKAHAG